MKCVECNTACNCEELFTINNRQVCRKCLFGDILPVTIYPIGIVNNDLERDNTPFGRKGTDTVSKIELLPSQKQFISGLDKEPEITIIKVWHKRFFSIEPNAMVLPALENILLK